MLELLGLVRTRPSLRLLRLLHDLAAAAVLRRGFACVSKPREFGASLTLGPRKTSHQFKGLRHRRAAVPSLRATTYNVTSKSVTVAGEQGLVSGMAGRYATALFELARETKA